MNYKIIPMTNDRVFKSVLSSIEARDYLIDIISGITGLPKANLKKDMTFVDSEHRISSKNESKKIIDLVVEVKDNVINLEMNNTYYKKLVDRNFEYIAKLKSNLIGESYNKIRKVIQINFDNFNRYNDDRAVIKFEMRDEKGIKEGVSLESYHVILPNVKEKYYNENNKDDLIGKLVIFVAERDEELQKLIISKNPDYILIGSTYYTRFIDYKKIKEIANLINAKLIVDISNISGLILTNKVPSPFEYTDYIICTLNKQLQGTNETILLSNTNELTYDLSINNTINTLNTLLNVTTDEYRELINNCLINAKELQKYFE